MVKKCCFAYCRNHQLKKTAGVGHIQFHSFPLSKPELLDKWLKAMNQMDFFPTLAHRLCSDHFTDDCFKESSGARRLLHANAVPSVFDFTGPLRSRKLKRLKERSIMNLKKEASDIKIASSIEEINQEKEIVGCERKGLVVVKHEEGECGIYDNSIENHDVIANISHELNVDLNNQAVTDSTRLSSRLIRKPCSLCCGDNVADSLNVNECEFPSEENIENESPVKEERNEFKMRHQHDHKNPQALLRSYREIWRCKLRFLRRDLKILQLRLKRRDKRISALKSLLEDMKQTVKRISRGEQFISSFEGFTRDLLFHAIRNMDAKKNAVRYSPEMKEFAISLYYSSSKAYDYVRSRLQLLPNPSLVKKWISNLNKPSIEIINDIGEELIIDNINDFIIIDHPIEGCENLT